MTRLLAVLLATTALPALACSDLPNICENHARAAAEAADYAYAVGAAQAAEREAYIEDAGEAYYDYGGDGYAPVDPMQAQVDAVAHLVALMAQQQADLAALASDPRYQRYQNGGWEYFQDQKDASPGEFCAAVYSIGETLVRVSGPGGDYDGALLTFWSPDIPTPDAVRQVPVTLIQEDGAQSVKAFNYRLANEAFGAVALAVPTLDALLDNMLDVQPFELKMDGRTVAKIEWKDGHAAREALRACTARR